MQQPGTMSSSSVSAKIEPSPKKLLDSSLSSMKSHRSVGGEDRFGESNETLNGSSQVRQPKRSCSLSPESVSHTIKALNYDASMQLMHERDLTRNTSARNNLEDSICIYHPSTAPAESRGNLTDGQRSSDFSANKSLSASVFSFDAILPKEQTMLSAEESCTVEEESYRSIDRFETVLLSSHGDVCRTLKPPIRQGSVVSLDTLQSTNDNRESCGPPTIEVTIADNVQIMNSGSSHQRFWGEQSYRSLTISAPVRSNSTEELDVFESKCNSITVEDNKSRLSEKYSTMISNRFQAGFSPERANTKVRSPALTAVPIDKIGKSRTPKAVSIDASTIDRASPGVESVSTNNISHPTTRSPGTTTSYQAAKSTDTRTISGSGNNHQFGSINESSKNLRGSDHSSRRKQRSNVVVPGKTNQSRASKEQLKSHPKSPVKKIDISVGRRCKISTESDSVLSSTLHDKEATILSSNVVTIKQNIHCDYQCNADLANAISLSSNDSRRSFKMVDKQYQLTSPKQVNHDESRRRRRSGEQSTSMSIISGDTSPGYASRVDVTDKANMLIPRSDSRIRPRSTNTTPEKDLVATSILVQLSSPVMQRDESVRRMATKRIVSRFPSRSTTSPSSLLPLPRDKSRSRARKAQNTEHGIDSDADTVNSMSQQSVKNRKSKIRPSDASTDTSTFSNASSDKGIKRDESRMRTRRTSHRSEIQKPDLGIGKPLEHSTISTPSSNEGMSRDESRIRRRRASNANDETKPELDVRKILDNSTPSSNKSMPRDASRTRIWQASNANDVPNPEQDVRKTLVNSAIAQSSRNDSQVRRRRALFSNELKSLENSTISTPSPSKRMERDESRTRRRRSSRADEASKSDLVGLKSSDGSKISLSLSKKNMQRDESRTRARQASHEYKVHKCEPDALGPLEVNSNKPLMQKKGCRKEALNDANLLECESEMMKHSKEINLPLVSVQGPLKYIVPEDRRKLVEKQEHCSYILEVLLTDSTATKKSAFIQRDESRIRPRRVETMPLDGNGESNGSEVKNRRDSTSAIPVASSRKSNATMLQITNKNKVPKIMEKDGSRKGFTKPPKTTLADADGLLDATTLVRTDLVDKAMDSPKTRPRVESSTDKNENDSPESTRLMTHNCHTERSCVRSFEVSRESNLTTERKPDACRELPSNLSLSLQNKDSPSDPSDSSSDPSLPDTEIDFVRLKLMAATKRQHAHKLVNEAMSVRFEVNANNSIMAASTQSALPKATDIDCSGKISGASTSQKIQQQSVDSQKSIIRATKENDQLRNKENVGNDAKALTGCSWNDSMKRLRVSSVSSDFNKFTALKALDNQLKTRHLRRLIDPSDDKVTNRRDSISSSWSYQSSSYQSSSYQSSSSDLGDSGVLENGDAGNISSRRLSIRQQRLPRRHFSRRIIGASLSLLSNEREKSNVDNTNTSTRNDKTDMMPQRPLRRSSQCSDEQSPSILTNLLGNEVASTGDCEKVCELPNEQQTVDVFEKVAAPKNKNSDEPLVVATTTTTTNIALMMNADGSMEDLFTQFSWSVVAASLDTTDEYEQRHELRNRIRHTPLHIAMERYYNEFKA